MEHGSQFLKLLVAQLDIRLQNGLLLMAGERIDHQFFANGEQLVKQYPMLPQVEIGALRVVVNVLGKNILYGGDVIKPSREASFDPGAFILLVAWPPDASAACQTLRMQLRYH